jgi:ABC-type multidrug transport system fused ATPase/permease subunit
MNDHNASKTIKSINSIMPVGALLVLGIVGRSATLATSFILGQLVNDIGKDPAGGSKHISDFFLVLLGALFGGAIVTLAFRVLLSHLSIRHLASIHDRFLQVLAGASKTTIDGVSKSEIVQLWSGDYPVALRYAGGSIGETVSNYIDMFLISLYFAIFSWTQVLPLAVVVSLVWVAYQKERPIIFAGKREASATRSKLMGRFVEDMEARFDMRRYGAEDFFNSRFNRAEAEWVDIRYKVQAAQVRYAWKFGALNGFALVVVGACGIWELQFGHGSLGSVVNAVTFALMGVSSLQGLMEGGPRLQEARSAYARLLAALRLFREKAMPVFEPATASRLVTLENATLRYPGANKEAFRGVNLTLGSGESLGVIGRSGSGKSSLVSALLGLYPLETGKLSIGRSCEDPRYFFAVIPQKPLFFAGTLRENLLGPAVMSDDAVLAMLDHLGAMNVFGCEVSRGALLDHQVETNGSNIPQGMRQILCAARALLKGAKVMIMDEATSELDATAERAFLGAVGGLIKEQSQIRIAHRMINIRDCDRIIWMEDGKIVMEGQPALIEDAFNRRVASEDLSLE